MKPNYFSIPKPCSEDWNEMSANAQGAFCSKCTKTVLDCSNLKPSEIKNAVANETQSTCLRIFNYQIDELNFTEWFNSLSLRKQLKYAFLFAFIFVFNTNLKAQELDTTLIQPQYVEIDPEDDMTTLQVLEEMNLQPDTLIETTYIPEVISVCEISRIEPWYIMGDMIVMGMIGNPIGPPAIESFINENPYLASIEEKNIDIIASNYLIVGDQKYTFLIEEDTLIFHSNSEYDELVHLKIVKKDDQKTVFFSPILIRKGQREVRFPLYEFNNGSYLIIVDGEKEAKGIELMYW